MNIRHTVIRLGAGLLLAALATSAFASSGSVSATANATLTVVAPDTLTKIKDIAFGTVIRPTTSTNTFTLSPSSGAVTVSGGGDGSAVTVTGSTSAAKFTFVAPAGSTYTPSATLNFTQAGLNNVAASAVVTTTGSVGVVPAGGSQDLEVGGQFDVSPSTTAQAYTGTLVLTLTYP